MNFKIKTLHPKISEAIQEKLFELGFKWHHGCTVYKTSAPYLFVDKDLMTWDEAKGCFDENESKEITIEELFKMGRTKKVKLFRYTYYQENKPHFYGQSDWISVSWEDCYLDKTLYELVHTEEKEIEL